MIDEIISPVYLVGGSVRDKLLGREPHDYDFATPLLPDEIEAKVKEAGKRVYTEGKRFGTIRFKLDGDFIEITTFRTEQYGESRKPEVKFVKTINQDLARRDLTINAIALRGTRYIDPFNGRKDIEDGIIRSVGNPSVRFNEDPLRMLRAARFTSQLGFVVEPVTKLAISKNAHKILTISREWWTIELDKLLLGDDVTWGLKVLAETDLLKFLVPELRLQIDYNQNSDYHDLDLWEHTLATVSKVPKDINLRWAALLHDVGKPFVRTDNNRGSSNYVFHDTIGAELVHGIGKRLKWSNERTSAVKELIASHLSDNSPLREADNSSKSRLPV